MLILPELVAGIFSFIAGLYFIGKAPNAKIDFEVFKSSFNFGISGLIINMSNYISNNFVVFFLGNTTNPDQLGKYYFAKRINDFGFSVIDAVLVENIFPIFTKARQKGFDLRKVSLDYTSFRILLVVPSLILLIGIVINFLQLSSAPTAKFHSFLIVFLPFK